MTRQQRRKMEREMKKEEKRRRSGITPVLTNPYKETNKKGLETHLFGVYYKDDKDEGFNFVVDDGNPELLHHMLTMFETVKQCFDKTHHLVSVKEVESNLQNGISFWNDYQNCHDRNPNIRYSIRVDLSNRELVESLFFILYGVYHLVQTGVIEDDNYNGFNFLRTYKKVG